MPCDYLWFPLAQEAALRSHRLKDEFGENHLMVKGNTKAMGHLMFGILALTADQLMRLWQ